MFATDTTESDASGIAMAGAMKATEKLEVPLKRIAQGVPVEQALNLGSVDDPSAVQWFVDYFSASRGGGR